jgi:hypothetical protein
MKSLLKLVYLLPLMWLLTACPYSSEIALDSKPTLPIDEQLIGTWEQRSSTDYQYVVSKIDRYTYQFEKITVSSGEKTIYNAFLSDVSGEKFMNVYEVSAESKTYYFYKLEINSPQNFKMISVTPNIDETFTSSEEMKKFFAQNKHLSFFFEKDEEEYIKIK